MFPCTNKATRYIRSLWMILLVNVITTRTTFLKSLVAGTVYYAKLTLIMTVNNLSADPKVQN